MTCPVTPYEGAAIIVSLLALVVSIWAKFSEQKTANRLREIEESRERDRKKAYLWAYVEFVHIDPNRKFPHLIIENTGNASARNVDLQVNSKTREKWTEIRKLPVDVTVIAPKSFVRYFIKTHQMHMPELNICLTWTDDSGEPGVWEQTVTP